MKINDMTIDALDEMLRLMIVEQSTAGFSNEVWMEQMAEHVLSASAEVLPTEEKSQELLVRLREEIKKMETFGDLLSSELQRQNIDLPALARATELSDETIEQLSRDYLFPNRVPVLLMRRLIEFVGVSLEKAKITLQRTAALIGDDQNKDFLWPTPVSARRRSIDNIGKERITTIDPSGLLDPHVAKTSLDIYLQRLEAQFTTRDSTTGEKGHE